MNAAMIPTNTKSILQVMPLSIIFPHTSGAVTAPREYILVIIPIFFPPETGYASESPAIEIL